LMDFAGITMFPSFPRGVCKKGEKDYESMRMRAEGLSHSNNQVLMFKPHKHAPVAVVQMRTVLS